MKELVIAGAVLLSSCANWPDHLQGRTGVGASPDDWLYAQCSNQTRSALESRRGLTATNESEAADETELTEYCSIVHMMGNNAQLRAEIINYTFPSSIDEAETLANDPVRTSVLSTYVNNQKSITDYLCSSFFNNLEEATRSVNSSRNLQNIAFGTLSTLMGLYDAEARAIAALSAADLALADVQQELALLVFLTPDPDAVYQAVAARQAQFYAANGSFEAPGNSTEAFSWARQYVEWCSPLGLSIIMREALSDSEDLVQIDNRNPRVRGVVERFVGALRTHAPASDPQVRMLGGNTSYPAAARALDVTSISSEEILLLYWYFGDADSDESGRLDALQELAALDSALADLVRPISPENDPATYQQMRTIWDRYRDVAAFADLNLATLQERLRSAKNDRWRSDLREAVNAEILSREDVSAGCGAFLTQEVEVAIRGVADRPLDNRQFATRWIDLIKSDPSASACVSHAEPASVVHSAQAASPDREADVAEDSQEH